MRLERFHRKHLSKFNGFSANEGELVPYMMAPELLDEAEKSPCWSGFEDGIFLGCGGFVKIHDYRALAWALLHPANPKLFLKIHRVVARLIDGIQSEFARIEAYTDPDFPQAARWMKMLGFRQEGEVKQLFLPDGRPAIEWIRIKEPMT